MQKKNGKFSVTREKGFPIWRKSPLLKRVLFGRYRPNIYHSITKEEILISTSFLGLKTISFSDG